MKFLKELFDLDAQVNEDKHTVITLKPLKPRAKQVNSVLRSKKGGRHAAPTDFDRNAVKRDTRKAMHEASEEDCCYFAYEVSWEVKNRGGDGPDSIDRHSHGVVKAKDKQDATQMVNKRYPKAMHVRITNATKAAYDKEMND